MLGQDPDAVVDAVLLDLLGGPLDDLLDLLTIREALEGMACRLAATRMTDAQIERLEALLPGEYLDVNIRPGENDGRKITLTARGQAAEHLIQTLRNEWRRTG